MDIQSLSKAILKEALTKGYFTLPNSSDIRELKPTEILSLAKYILKEGIVLEDEEKEDHTNLPNEMFSDKENSQEEVENSREEDGLLTFIDFPINNSSY